MRPIGTAKELERRRRRAVQFVNQGERPITVARFLGCGRSSVYTWLKQEREAPDQLPPSLTAAARQASIPSNSVNSKRWF